MEIWLIRHGATTANQEGRFQGRLDYPLSDQGRCEADLLSRRLKNVGLEFLYSSDLNRAWETAQIMAATTGLRPVSSPLLRECSWGAAEGLTQAEIQACLLPPFFYAGRDRLKPSSWGGESKRKLMSRAGHFLKMVDIKRNGFSRVAVVSHGRLINALFAAAFGLKARRRWPFSPSPASLPIISRRAGESGYRLELFNDRCHLDYVS